MPTPRLGLAPSSSSSSSSRVRSLVLLVVLALVALALAAPAVGAEGTRVRPKYNPQAAVKNELNRDRVANRRVALRTQAAAQAKAQAWANRLASEGRMYHSNLRDGINVKWCSLGENVGYGPSVASIERAYMKSPGHRANILNTKWNGVGVGYATRGSRVYTVHVFIKTC